MPEVRVDRQQRPEDSHYSTPAVSNGRIFIKGKSHLWCIGNRNETGGVNWNSELPFVEGGHRCDEGQVVRDRARDAFHVVRLEPVHVTAQDEGDVAHDYPWPRCYFFGSCSFTANVFRASLSSRATKTSAAVK